MTATTSTPLTTTAARRHTRHRLPRQRWLIFGLILIALLPLLSLIGLRAYTDARADVYALDAAPHRRVGLVFGAQVMPSGRLSAMLADRVRMGAELYHAGKVDVLLLSGDNSTSHYNEPAAMRRFALELGVPDDALVLDYAGRRTYDSCYRARDIFGVESATLVTQNFHLDRALLLCNELGIEAIGVAADAMRPRGYNSYTLTRLQAREYAATALAVWDLIRRPTPILGDPLPIFPANERLP